MTDQHPITPPPEPKQQWREQAPRYHVAGAVGREHWLMERAAQWGYDQRGEVNEAKMQEARDEELEACCEWLSTQSITDALCDYDLKPIADDLRAARRPKPPSLKEQALEDLEQIDGHAVDQLSAYVIHGDLKRRVSNIRRALEALPDE